MQKPDAREAVIGVAGTLDAWTRSTKDAPIRTAVLWDRPAPRTSQRRALVSMSTLVTILLGGNRTGKTEGGAIIDVVTALGRGHPDVDTFIARNGIDPETVPEGPGLVVVVTLSHKDSREYMRPKLERYCPAGTVYKGWGADDEAQAILPNGGRILCKAVRQGREAFQGFAARLVHFDEEPYDMSVVLEAMRALVDHAGKMLLTLTPLRGWSLLLERYVREPRPDTRVHWLHGRDNPHIPQDALENILAQYGPHEREARAFGRVTALEGRVYAFHRDLHVVKPIAIPESWKRIRVWDFGVRNPTCVLWMAQDPGDDVIYVYREHYKAGLRLSQHAEQVITLSGHEQYATTVCDSEDLNARETLAAEHGIHNEPSQKGVRANINAVAERLAPDAEGKPHLLIFETCVNTIREFETYVWAQSRSLVTDTEKPVKTNDHAMDCIGYGCRWWADDGGAWLWEVVS